MIPAERIAAALKDYEQIDVLAPLRHQSPLVPGDGPLDAPVMLIGEAPGEEETEQLRPFVGPAGRFLDIELAEAGIPRQLCYVTNVVLYRPPGNRTPEQFEIHVSRKRLFAEIRAVAPKLIITLGSVARRAMSKGPPVSQCHGQLEIDGLVYAADFEPGQPAEVIFTMLPTFHPSAAIRDRIIHAKMREDLSVLTRLMEGR